MDRLFRLASMVLPFIFFIMGAIYVFDFQVDDAYIFLRYARNFSDGYGLVFNPGELVEGYTSLLLVLLESILFRAGIAGDLALPVGKVFLVSFSLGSIAVVDKFIVQKQQEQKRATSKLEVALIEQEMRDYVLSQKPQYLLQALHLMDDPRFRVAYAPKAEFSSVGDSSCAPDIAWSLVVFERVPD